MSPKSASPLIAVLAALLVSACAIATSPSGGGDPMPSFQTPDH